MSPKQSSMMHPNYAPNSPSRQSGGPHTGRTPVPNSPRQQGFASNTGGVNQSTTQSRGPNDVGALNVSRIAGVEQQRVPPPSKPAIPPRSISQDRQSSVASTERWIYDQNKQLNFPTGHTSNSGRNTEPKFKSHLQFEPTRPPNEHATAMPHNRSQESLDRLSIRAFESSENLHGLTSPTHVATQQQQRPPQSFEQHQQQQLHQFKLTQSEAVAQPPTHRAANSSQEQLLQTHFSQNASQAHSHPIPHPWATEPRADVTGIKSISLHLKDSSSNGDSRQPPQVPVRTIGQSNFFSPREVPTSPLALQGGTEQMRARGGFTGEASSTVRGSREGAHQMRPNSRSSSVPPKRPSLSIAEGGPLQTPPRPDAVAAARNWSPSPSHQPAKLNGPSSDLATLPQRPGGPAPTRWHIPMNEDQSARPVPAFTSPPASSTFVRGDFVYSSPDSPGSFSLPGIHCLVVESAVVIR